MLALPPCYDCLVTNNHNPTRTPPPSRCRRACTLVGCLPSEALHVGDSLIADVNGAAAAGLAGAVWVNRNGERPLPVGVRPAAILSSVLELPSALDHLQVLFQQRVQQQQLQQEHQQQQLHAAAASAAVASSS